MTLHTLARGDSSLVIDFPHSGVVIPPALEANLTAAARVRPDTDWHVEKLYGFARDAGATLVVATHSRYVVDLNRDPRGVSLYPGADVTELCPTTTFANEPIWTDGTAPNTDDVAARRAQFFDPYHATLQAEIERVRDRHGYAVLLDAHSIRSEVPRFFAGRLPDLNLGTVNGASCAPALEAIAGSLLAAAAGFTHVVNGRFKGGYVTRHYGAPARNIHALQLEIAQACYMDERPPYPWDPQRASALVAVLTQLVDALRSWQPQS
jgi:N-formylglutamate deformylase